MSDAPLSVLHAVVLGLIQALTEFLPVSSSGHLVIGQAILGVKLDGGALFEVAVHLGTLLSILVILRAEVSALLLGLVSVKARTETWWQDFRFMIISMIPAGVIGALFKDELESTFNHLSSVGSALILTGVVLLSTRRLEGQRTAISKLDAVLIGLAQAVAILPGISRSGSTISAALWLGIERARAARLSFLMSLPVVGGAGLLKALDLIELSHTSESALEQLTPISIGLFTSFIFGLFALSAMLRWISRPSFSHFGYYCLAAGLASLYAGM